MISGVILSHDSEQTIERAIDSLDFCDEVLVIDDESSDTTVRRAKGKKARVINRALNTDFAKQRNFGITEAKGDWVLFLDSDEIVPKALAVEIRTAIEDTKISGYFLKREDYLFGKRLQYGETANVRLLRLAKKNAGTWIRSVHEVWDIMGETRVLKTPLSHYPHQTIHEFIAEINHYSTINAHEFYRAGRRTNWFEILAYPKGKFIQNYFLRQGFRDGMPGLVVATLMSFHSFLTRGKLYLLEKNA